MMDSNGRSASLDTPQRGGIGPTPTAALAILALVLLGEVSFGITQPIDPNSITFFIQQGQQAAERYRYQEALDWFDKARAAGENTPFILMNIAKQQIGLEQLDEARQTLNDILAIDPTNAEAHIFLGIYFQRIKEELAPAEDHFRQAIRLDPDLLRSSFLLGDLYISQHRYEEAKVIFNKVLSRYPDSFQALLGLGTVLVKETKYSEAIAQFKKAISQAPYEPEPYRLMGQSLARLNERDLSKKYFEQYQELKKRKNAVAEMERIVRHNPANAANWFALGNELVRQNRIPQAIDALEKGLEIDSGNTTFLGLLGALYIKANRIEPAMRYLNIAIQRDPSNQELFNNLGVCHMMLRNYPDAIKAFERSIALGNQTPQIYKNLEIAKRKLRQSDNSIREKN